MSDKKVYADVREEDAPTVMCEFIAHCQWAEYVPMPDGMARIYAKSTGARIISGALGLESEWLA